MSSPAIDPAIQEAIDTAVTGNQGWNDVNQIFVIQTGALVFFMHTGFAMLSIGSVRAKFAKHIAILVLLDACASALGYYLFGFAFAFGDSLVDGPNGGTTLSTQNGFIGSHHFAMQGVPQTPPQTPIGFWLWFFEWTFAATACTIVSGAIAERAKIESYVVYSFFMAAWVYPVITHSIWSWSGWASMFRTSGPLLFKSGAIDYAGSGAVHMVGGMAALCGSWILGPRIGRFGPNGEVNTMEGHNASLFVLGVMILWFGWYGFNPGSQLALVNTAGQAATPAISYSAAVANAAVTTTISPATAGLSGLLFRTILDRRVTGKNVYDIMTMGNACLAGLVAVTAGCSTVYPWGALCIGGTAGILYVLASKLVVAMRIDDPLDAIAVHFFNGWMGVIAVGFFAGKPLVYNAYGSYPDSTLTIDDPRYFREYGCFLGGSGRLLAAQIVYSLWIIGWVAANMLPFFFLLKKLGLFRVSPEDETEGLDHSYHGGSAYVGGPEDTSTRKGGYGLNGGGMEVNEALNTVNPVNRVPHGATAGVKPTKEAEMTAV
jgi:Amt family ammonium transporter